MAAKGAPSGTSTTGSGKASSALAVVKKALEGTPAEWWVKMNPPAYADLARRHRLGIEAVEGA